MRIVLFGATGVVGRRAIPLLAGRGDRVVAAVRSERSAGVARELGAEPRITNLFDAGDVRAAMDGADVVVNLATSIPPSSRALLPGAWRENARVRQQGSANVAAAATAAGVAVYVQESFAPVYEDAGERWIDETAPVRTTSHTHAVLDAEAAVHRYLSQSRAGRGVILRFGLFYGPDSDFTRDMLRGVRLGVAMAFGGPRGYMSPLSHDDAATAVVSALGAPSGTYNVTDDEPVTRRDFYDALARVAGARPPVFLPASLGRLAGSVGDILMRSQRISNRRFRDATGWAPRYPSVREGAATLVP